MAPARLATIALVCLVVAEACGGAPPTSATRMLGPNEYALPADPSLALGPNATPQACGGVGLDAVLTGDVSDSRKVWLEDAQTGGRLDLVWPTGFTARFRQGDGFDVLDTSGDVAIVGGSHVSDACVAGSVYWLDDVAQ